MVVALDTNELEPLAYDAGRIKFIASSADTNGACAVMELLQMPGYRTSWHQHNNCDESFYVLEGVLTITIADKTNDFGAGSYLSIPSGTPHGQGDFAGNPIRLLVTFTPGGAEEFFKARVELFKAVKPNDATFQEKFDELCRKHKKHIEILGVWDIKK